MKIFTRIFIIRLICTGLFVSLFFGYSNAQNNSGINSVTGKLIRITPKLGDIDKSMKGPIFNKTRDINGIIGFDDESVQIHKLYPSTITNSTDRALQTNGIATPLTNTLSSTILSNFDGLGFTNVAPSDNSMAAGPGHIIQMINNSTSSYFEIWNKTGTQLQSKTLLSSLTGITGVGDPVVIYDQLADRFILTEFGKSAGVTTYPNTLLMAISVTADPTGSWKIYSFPNSGFFADYPKFSVWQNAYYATTNDFNTTGTAYLGSSVYAFDRAAMLAGAATATVVSKRFTDSADRYYSMEPVCVEGTVTSTQSGLFAFLQDDAWTSDPADADSIFVMEFTPDFVTPSASVFGVPTAMMSTLPYNTNVPDLKQQGSSQTIQALSERLMFKVIYRNFGDHESIVCNTTVNVGANRAGIRWWELRRPGGNWGIYQEGTFAPSTDANNRFMGAVSINATGSIGLLYNVTGTTAFPSLWFTARSGCDPLGTMSLPETVIINGTAANANNRYGDYNSLTNDPADGSFWGTGQYNVSGAWSTRIVNLSLTGGNVNFLSHPSNVTTCSGNTASFAVAVTGAPSATYQWQVSTDSGISFTNITGATASTYSFIATVSQHTNKYRAVVNGGCLVNSNSALLTINGASFTSSGQPKNVSACAGTNATFNVVSATGSNLLYQWQVSVNGGAFINLVNNTSYSGTTTNTLTITSVDMVLNGYKYRVTVSNAACGEVVSDSAVLEVNPLPDVILSADFTGVNPGLRTNLYTTINPAGSYTFQWYKNGALVPSRTTASFMVSVDDFGNYEVIATDTKGCSSKKSNIVSITDSASIQLFVYPNPSTGIFQVRYYNAGNPLPVTARTLNIYNALGSRMYSKTFPINERYDKMEVNMSNAQKGVYLIEIRDISGKRIANGKIIIE